MVHVEGPVELLQQPRMELQERRLRQIRPVTGSEHQVVHIDQRAIGQPGCLFSRQLVVEDDDRDVRMRSHEAPDGDEEPVLEVLLVRVRAQQKTPFHACRSILVDGVAARSLHQALFTYMHIINQTHAFQGPFPPSYTAAALLGSRRRGSTPRATDDERDREEGR